MTLSLNNLSKRINQTKQSEKLMKTDYFKNLKDDQREAEKMKLNLKLGQWAFALNKNRVYKYSKDYYDIDKFEAKKRIKKLSDMLEIED